MSFGVLAQKAYNTFSHEESCGYFACLTLVLVLHIHACLKMSQSAGLFYTEVPAKLSKFQYVALTANGSSLEHQKSFKYLGVTFNQNLSCSNHISNLSKKVNQCIGLIRRLKHLIPLNAGIFYLTVLFYPCLTMPVLFGETTIMLCLWTTYRYCRIMQLGSYLICRALIRQRLKPWTN